MPQDAIDRFLDQAERHPERPAVVLGGNSITYRQFACRVRALAGRFARFSEPRVIVALPQTTDAYAAILAAGLAGGYHIPLNLASPIEKMRRIASIVDPDVVVASARLLDELRAHAPRALSVDPTAVTDDDLFLGNGRRHDLAYVIFTSGSTGTPKGVVVPRRGLDNYVDWLETLEIGIDDRISQHPNLAFDISMTDIFGALCFGASLFPVSEAGDRLMPARMIARDRITVWNSVPSVVGLMMHANQVTRTNLESVRLFNFCGEPLLPDHLRAIFAVRPDALVQNTYGPTEATIAVTCLRLRRSDFEAACGASVALGDPLPGMAIDLLGGTHTDEGEIVTSGPQLAVGYWEDPTRTSASFREIELGGRCLRGYFTGDWAERRDGRLFFKERMDFQVKVMGYRIELDEVAAAIRACGWTTVCVFKRGERLAAVVERTPARHFDEAELVKALCAKLEAYAIPETILETEHMPRNENDKLDRSATAAWLERRMNECISPK